MLDLAVPLGKDVLPKLATKATSSALHIFEKTKQKQKQKQNGQGAVRVGRRLTSFISNEDMDNIIKIVELIEKSGLLVDGARKTVKHGIKKQLGGFLPAMMTPMATSLIAPMASSLI